MALNDFYGGTGWSGHNAPSSTQTNPNNDPTIAASQAQLRNLGNLTIDQLTNPRLTGNTNMGTGDMPNIRQSITYDSPYGPITMTRMLGEGVEGMAGTQIPTTPPKNASYSTGEKYWWQDGLAEQAQFGFGEDGKLTAAKPRDTRYSMGEQLGDFVGNIATMVLTAYGLNYAAGAINGAAAGGVGTGNMTAGELAAMDAAGGGMAGTGLPGAAAPALGGTGAMTAGELAAMDAAGGAMAGTGLPYAAAPTLTEVAAGGSILDTLIDGGKKLGGEVIDGISNGISNGSIQDLIRNGGSLALMKEMFDAQKGNAEEWRNFMKGAAPDVGFYQGQLKNTYENPMDWLNGPQYQAAQAVTHNKLQRSDAAGGRLANDFGRQQQLQDHAMGSLAQHQQGLAGIVNQHQNTASGQGASNALGNAQAAEGDWMKNLMNWLNSQGKT